MINFSPSIQYSKSPERSPSPGRYNTTRGFDAIGPKIKNVTSISANLSTSKKVKT